MSMGWIGCHRAFLSGCWFEGSLVVFCHRVAVLHDVPTSLSLSSKFV